MSGLLLDTHILLAISAETLSTRLPRVSSLLDRADAPTVASTTSLWEIAIKLRLGKLEPDRPLSKVAVRTRPAPSAQGLARHDEVLSMDQSSPTTAFVKLRCAIPPRFFTDYLSLLKIDGRWQVAQKVFATRTGGPEEA